MSEVNLVDHGFMDTRAKILDIAAFLDRVQRHGQAEDWRIGALRDVLPLLSDPQPHRVQRILEALSDPSEQPIAAAPMQGAIGAWARKSSL
jgi:hypothetical protein